MRLGRERLMLAPAELNSPRKIEHRAIHRVARGVARIHAAHRAVDIAMAAGTGGLAILRRTVPGRLPRRHAEHRGVREIVPLHGLRLRSHRLEAGSPFLRGNALREGGMRGESRENSENENPQRPIPSR